MSFARVVVGSVLCVVAALAACSSDDAGKTPSQLASEDNAQVLCERLFSCCTPAELAALPFVDTTSPPTRDGCIAYHTQAALDFVAVTEAEAAAGRLAVHVDRSAACVADRRSEPCAAFHERLRAIHIGDAYALCNEAVVEPLTADDGDCRFYLDCRGGFCDLPAGASTSADAGPEATGKCKPLPTAKAPCSADGCAAGLRCDPDTTMCVAFVKEGAACDADDACASGACRGGKCVSPGLCGG